MKYVRRDVCNTVGEMLKFHTFQFAEGMNSASVQKQRSNGRDRYLSINSTEFTDA
jgi:hypothetical protein